MTPVRSLDRTIYTGFSAVLLLMLLLAAMSLYQINSANETVTKIVENNNAKIEYAHAMREAIRLRQSNVNTMLATKNIFDRDLERLRFYENGKLYRESRIKLLQLPTTDTETVIHRLIQETAREAEPLSNILVDLLIEDAPEQDINKTLVLARNKQSKLMALLSELIELQTQYANHALAEERRKYQHIILFVSLLGLVVLIVSLVIVKRVSAYVSSKNHELMLKNHELSSASQRAMEATQTTSVFVETIGRQIRNTLATIIDVAHASLTPGQDKNQQTNVTPTQSMIQHCKHLLQFIDEQLAFAQRKKNPSDIELVTINPFQLLNDIKSTMSRLADEKGLGFFIDYHYPLPGKIINDPKRLQQILLNLCENAIKYTKRGHINIEVSYEQQKQQMTFMVIDTGIGMTVEQIKHIFNSPAKPNAEPRAKNNGLGLGLYLSKILANRINGQLNVESLHGLGSRCSITVNTGTITPSDWIQDESQLDISKQDLPKSQAADALRERTLTSEHQPEPQPELQSELQSEHPSEHDSEHNNKNRRMLP